MKAETDYATIETVPERCRLCYTCVRECPAKAIRIIDGQARVLHERCIGCGNCVRVCSQNAKQVVSSISQVRELIADAGETVAIVAPSFPAEFVEWNYLQLVGALRALGFSRVCEVAFGADLVARAFRKLLQHDDGKRYIATSCPAVVFFVEKYHPDLVDALAPIVSPMVAAARVVRHIHGNDTRVVFVGPCTAKKGEQADDSLAGETDAVLTFSELRDMMKDADLQPNGVAPAEFDPPFARMGALFPLCDGMLEAANINDDIITGEVVAAYGRKDFVEAIKEFEGGDLDVRLLETLACDGCIMGAGMTTKAPRFSRHARVRQYVQGRINALPRAQWENDMARCACVDLSRKYKAKDQRLDIPNRDTVSMILARMGKKTPEDELNCGACGYETCREHAIAIYKGLAENEMCLPYTIAELQGAVVELERSHTQLANTQEALMHSEKLASMGQLAAGIAHEVNNPLGVILMYSHMLRDSCKTADKQHDDADMIATQADRCKKIVSGLLHFARQNKVLKQPVDLKTLVERALNTVARPDNIKTEKRFSTDDTTVEIDGDQIMQVLTNLMSNAYAAMAQGGTLTIAIRNGAANVQLLVSDTGVGIPEENRGKIFEPFFTTKQLGKGTGLGLSVTYGIIKMHNGAIAVESNTDPQAGPVGTTFTVTLPRGSVEVSDDS